MNYAALLVVLLALAFAFPALVRLARDQGIPQGASIAAAVCGAAFVLAWHLIRQRVKHDRDTREKIDRIRAQVSATPTDPRAYFADGEHLGDLLIRLKHHDEALEVFEQYLALEQSQGRQLPKLEQRILRLRAGASS